MKDNSAAPKAIADGIPVWCRFDELVDPIALVPNPRNPNKHPERQIEIGARIIKAHGWRHPIVVSRRSGFITKGHGRLLFAQRLGVKLVPVEYQDYATEAEEWQDILADNKLQELASPDLDMVADILRSVEEIDHALTAYQEHEIALMLREDISNVEQELCSGPDSDDYDEENDNFGIDESEVSQDGVSYVVYISFSTPDSALEFCRRLGFPDVKFRSGSRNISISMIEYDGGPIPGYDDPSGSGVEECE
jgi:Predicted transcriptional regulators